MAKVKLYDKSHSINLKIRTFIDNSADLLKKHLTIRNFFTTGTYNEIMWKFLFCHTKRDYIINVISRIVFFVLGDEVCRYTLRKRAFQSLFLRKNYYSNAPQCYHIRILPFCF